MFEREFESDLSQYCQWTGVGILPYFPLTGGLLAGRYTRGEEPASDSRAGSDAWGAGMRRYFDHYGTEKGAILPTMCAFTAVSLIFTD